MMQTPGGSGTLTGDERQTGVTFETILRAVAEQNPMVEAARRRWVAATYKRPQMVSLPDPKLEYRYFVRQMAREEEQWELSLAQEIPYPDKLYIAGKIADKEAEMAYVRYQMALRNAFAEAKEVYCEIYYIDRARQITADVEQLYARYAALAIGGTAVAQPKLPERFRAESQRAQLGYDLVLLQEMRVAEVERLRAVAGMPKDWQMAQVPDLAEPREFNQPLEKLQEQAGQFNQELAAAGIEVERAQYQTQLARRAPLPDVMLGASYMRTGDVRAGPDPTRDPITVGVGVSIPLWVGKYKAMLYEAQEAARAAAAEQGAQQLQIRADLARAYFSLNNAARLVRLYRDTLIPQARQALRSAEELYRKGEANLAAVLETTATVHNFELARVRATADFYQNVARVERVLGTALDLQQSSHTNAGTSAESKLPAGGVPPRMQAEETKP
jgi:outer membrane protein TolC